MSATELRLQPASSHQYYGFYLLGFERLLGPLKLRFDRGVSPLPAQVAGGIGLVVGGRRIWIAAGDNAYVPPEPLEWCDTYGAVNLLPEHLELSPKIVPIGPSFGIRWRTLSHTVRYVLRAAAAQRSGPRATAARLTGSIDYHRTRLPLERYDEVRPGEPGYLFFVGTYWAHDRPPPPARGHFIEAAHQLHDIEFEGGWVPQPQAASEVDPAHLAQRGYPLPEYLDRLQRSMCTFNTPAVWNCLGWKLGENLALGKAIITTPLDRVLPEPLVHGVHVHQVEDDVEAMAEAIAVLSSDHEYRRSLERAARAYWDRWLAPERVVQRLLDHRA